MDKKFIVTAIVLQVILFALYAGFVSVKTEDAAVGYSMFQDIHIMIFIGFGFLMTFLKKYGFSSLGQNMLVSAIMIQWGLLLVHFWHKVWDDELDHNIHISASSLFEGDYSAATALITMGALLGKVRSGQLLFITFIEMIFYTFNVMLVTKTIHTSDAGGSMVLHAFGCYFGFGVSLALRPPTADKRKNCTSNYISDMFAMIGTLFLYCFWPSFIALPGGTPTEVAHAVVSCVFALCGSCVSAFVMSTILRHEHKFEMVDVQNATLAGGVAIGSCCILPIPVWAALLIGIIAGVLSVVGFVIIQPQLEVKLGIHDSCGVNNLHGMPGLLGGIASMIACGVVDYTFIHKGEVYTNAKQVVFQVAGFFTNLAIALVSGFLVGLISKPIYGTRQVMYSDDDEWQVPVDFEREAEPMLEDNSPHVDQKLVALNQHSA